MQTILSPLSGTFSSTSGLSNIYSNWLNVNVKHMLHYIVLAHYLFGTVTNRRFSAPV